MSDEAKATDASSGVSIKFVREWDTRRDLALPDTWLGMLKHVGFDFASGPDLVIERRIDIYGNVYYVRLPISAHEQQ